MSELTHNIIMDDVLGIMILCKNRILCCVIIDIWA